MARIRTVKPELFRHEKLFDIEQKTGFPIRLAWIGLFCVADRDGRFCWRPRALKPDILPYDDDVDFGALLEALADAKLLIKYDVDGETYGSIPSWNLHQIIRADEAKSRIPAPPLCDVSDTNPLLNSNGFVTNPKGSHMSDGSTRVVEGKGKEGKGKEMEGKGSGKEGTKKPEPNSKEPLDPGKTKERFEVIEALRGNATLESVLQSISPGVQQTWIERYEKKWLRERLFDAIQHHLQKEGASEPSQITDWGKRLVRWLRFEKKPSLLNPGANPTPEKSEEEEWNYIFSEQVDNAEGGTTP